MSNRTLPRRDQVLDLLAGQPRALHARELAERLGVAEGEYLQFLALLHDLAFDRLIRALPGQRYGAVAGARPTLREGRLTVNPRGFGFVSTPGVAEDLFVPAEAIGGGMHGDMVRASIVGRSRRGLEGRVLDVLERARARVQGVYRHRGQSAWLEPDDTRIRGPIVIKPVVEGPDGHAAVVTITRYPMHADENPEASVLEVIGPPGEPLVETRKILVREGLEESFGEQVQQEVAAFGDRVRPSDYRDREDLRQVPLVTIDPEDARDHDDAIWVQQTDDGFEACIAIADVAHYVREGTKLDEAGYQRSFSVYLPDRAVAMLPAELSSHLCSLLPERIRLCMAVHVQLDRSGKVRASRVCEAVMRSHARLTYPGVAAALKWTDAPKPAALSDELRTMLTDADALARVLRKRRLRRGALDFVIPEAQVVLEPQTLVPIDVVRRAQDPGVRRAYQLIEELMLLANEVVANWLIEREVPGIFRVHAPPDEAKIERLAALCDALGVAFDPEEAADAKSLGAFLTRVADHPLSQTLSVLALRSLKQAAYDAVNVGHFGLASAAYVHFTSPIRRYPDLTVHRLVKQALHQDSAADEQRLVDIAAHCTKREREVVEVEREVVDLYRALFMRKHIGTLRTGTIVEIFGNGAIAALDEPFVDVRIPLELVGPDSYEATDDGLHLVGMRSGDRVTLGDRVLVRIEDVQLERKAVIGRRMLESRPGRGRRERPKSREGSGRGERKGSNSKEKKRR